MPRHGKLYVRFDLPLDAAVAAPGEDAAAPGERPLAAPQAQDVDETLDLPWESFYAEQAAVAAEPKEQDPAARSDSASEAAVAKEELKDRSADELANDGEDKESVNDALSTVTGDSGIDEEEELTEAGPKKPEH